MEIFWVHMATLLRFSWLLCIPTSQTQGSQLSPAFPCCSTFLSGSTEPLRSPTPLWVAPGRQRNAPLGHLYSFCSHFFVSTAVPWYLRGLPKGTLPGSLSCLPPSLFPPSHPSAPPPQQPRGAFTGTYLNALHEGQAKL